MIVAPSLLASNPANLSADIKRLNDADFKILHLDIMDGHFVPNISFGPSVVKALRPLTLMIFDVHLMISNPLQYLDDFVDAGADYITFHLEAVTNPFEVINAIKAKGVKVGLSIKPQTNLEAIKPYLKELDLILVMSVEPGFGGQEFQTIALEKITNLKKWREQLNLTYLIQVDGGINDVIASLVKKAGADIIVVGTYLFRQFDLIRAKVLLES